MTQKAALEQIFARTLQSFLALSATNPSTIEEQQKAEESTTTTTSSLPTWAYTVIVVAVVAVVVVVVVIYGDDECVDGEAIDSMFHELDHAFDE